MKLSTHLIHTGDPHPRVNGAVCLPIFQSANFETEETNYHDICYARLSNTPNHIALHEKIAAIEGAPSALVTASGMAAISTTLLTLLHPGDHFLVQGCLYGGTHDFITNDCPHFGIQFDFVDPNQPEDWKAKLKPQTKLFYSEVISNPLMGVPNLKEIVRFSKQQDLVTVIDNTFASPVNFQPILHGFDVVVESATKYLNGHSDIVAGSIAGNTETIRKIKYKLDHLGGSLDPHACFLLYRGLKTLAVRMQHHNQSALKIAQFLAEHPAVQHVNYPGLENHPQYQMTHALFKGFSGMISFELKQGLPAAHSLLQKIKLPIQACSLGGVESLITRPVASSHAGLSPEARQKIGISDSLVRLSVGLEDTEDLINDLQQALS